jgi:hypothetical protein
MPPTQAQVASRSFSDVRQPALNLTYVVLSLSFILICGSFLVCSSIIRRSRCRPINDGAPHFTSFTGNSPNLLSDGIKKRTSFCPTVSALVTQSTMVASSPLRLKIIPKLGNPSTPRWPMNFLSHGFERFLSWGRETIGLVRVVATASSASVQQLFFGVMSLIDSSTVASSNKDGSRHSGTASSLSTLCEPHSTTRALKPFPGWRQQPISSNSKEHAGTHRHLSRPTNPFTDKDEPEPDIHVPDTINIPQFLRLIEGAQCKTDTPVIPLIILSLPSSERLIGETPQPSALDQDFLSPDGTFRSSGPPGRVTAETPDVSGATRLALASRLRERRKHVSLPSPTVLATPSMAHWPRWF